MVLGRWQSQAPTSEFAGVPVVYGWVHPGGPRSATGSEARSDQISYRTGCRASACPPAAWAQPARWSDRALAHSVTDCTVDTTSATLTAVEPASTARVRATSGGAGAAGRAARGANSGPLMALAVAE